MALKGTPEGQALTVSSKNLFRFLGEAVLTLTGYAQSVTNTEDSTWTKALGQCQLTEKV